METVVASDPGDRLDTANAIRVSFLEMIAGHGAGYALEPCLDRECRKFYELWLSAG